MERLFSKKIIHIQAWTHRMTWKWLNSCFFFCVFIAQPCDVLSFMYYMRVYIKAHFVPSLEKKNIICFFPSTHSLILVAHFTVCVSPRFHWIKKINIRHSLSLSKAECVYICKVCLWAYTPKKKKNIFLLCYFQFRGKLTGWKKSVLLFQ